MEHRMSIPESDADNDSFTYSTAPPSPVAPSRRALCDFFASIAEESKVAIETLISTLEELPTGSPHDLDRILDPSFQNERLLRTIFLLAKRQATPIPDHYIGLLKVFDLPLEARRTQRPEHSADEIFSDCPVPFLRRLPMKHLMSLAPNMRRIQESPAFVDNIDTFKENLNVFTDNAILAITDWSNMVIAGGAVLACVMAHPTQLNRKEYNALFHSDAYQNSDLDIFLYGLTPNQATIRMQRLYEEIDSASSWNTVCVRKKNTISIHTSWPKRTLQIVLRLYQSPGEILAGFDVDASCFAYDGTHVFTNPRGLAAVIRQANTLDLNRRSRNYPQRLVKYGIRGFEIRDPDLDRRRIDYEALFDDRMTTTWPPNLAYILVKETIFERPDYFPLLSRQGPQIRRREDNADVNEPGEESGSILDNSDYDTIYFRIHYNRENDAAKVERDVRYVDRQMNSQYNPQNQDRRLHRHAVTCGTMQFCVGNFCEDCPQPQTSAEHALIMEEANYIRGPVTFLEDDPGRQEVGSINPMGPAGWYLEAYGKNGLP